MTALIADPRVAECIIAERRARGWDRQDEVWDGIYIIMPDPNIEHQEIVSGLVGAFREVVGPPAGGKVLPGFNISDRARDWTFNYRCPDVGVLLAGNQAEIFEAHVRGPADFLVEIVSPGDKSRDKFDFYGELRVCELLLIDRHPWSLELYQYNGSQLVLAGRSSLPASEVFSSVVLPLSFQLVPSEPRPEIRIAKAGGTRSWVA
jgi:Uma2 family endonuclease